MSKPSKQAVLRALSRLATHNLMWDSVTDARLVRRFVNAECLELQILRRYVKLAADVLETVPRSPSFSIAPSLVAELRDVANPKRKK